MCRLAVLLAVATACGRHAPASAPDGPPGDAGPALLGQPLEISAELAIVAHQDDDLLFMQPDMYQSVSAHHAITIVYVTAGDGGVGLPYADGRVANLKVAYSLVSGATGWSCGWVAIADHAAQHCRLADANLSLVFLGYPDGGVSGELPNSLLALWTGAVAGADTVADVITHYDRTGLIATISEVVTATQPHIIRTLDIAGTHGADHNDHVIVGALAMLGAAAANTPAEIVSYRGYDTAAEPAQLPDALYDQVSLGMRGYESCAGVAGCDATCGTPCSTIDDPRYYNFLHRRYATTIRRPPLTGRLRVGDQCVVPTSNGLGLGTCSGAPELAFDRGGNIRIGERCLEVEPDATLGLGECGGNPARNFMLDDEGHVWSGSPPDTTPDAAVMHARCVVARDSGALAIDVCGDGRDWRWQLERATMGTTRASLGLTQTGRAVRLGDVDGDGKADLCAIETTGLRCALGDGHGRFAPAIRIDVPGNPLAIEPESLALGDVDGDGRTDACGRTMTGVACATAATEFAAAPWSTDLPSTGSPSAADRSTAVVDRSVCGMTNGGVGCTPTATILSAWPASTAAVWPAELDADGLPDWCAATASGFACSRTSDRAITTDGVPWSYSLQGAVENTSGIDPATAGLADVTGDGRSDACTAAGGIVTCAISQRYGFGPGVQMLALPSGAVITGLWLGDLDGDGKADTCVDDGTTITCAPSP